MDQFSIERKQTPSRLSVIGVSLLAILLGLLVASIIFVVYGINPWEAYREIGVATLGSRFGLLGILRRSIPLLLVGIGLVLAFRTKFWNIGAEGQLLAGSVGATAVAIFSGLPAPWIIIVEFVAGFVAGALWGLIPALLNQTLKVNDVIATLMLNYVMIYLVKWLIFRPWKGSGMRGVPSTNLFPGRAQLPMIPRSNVHWPTLLLGLAAAFITAFIISRTGVGYEIQVLGGNTEAADYAGINTFWVVLFVMTISGGLAGLAGVGEVAGIHHKLRAPTQISMGYGYTGIIVAWLARGNPIVVIFTSLLFGLFFAAGDVMEVALGMPFQVTHVFNGLILLFLIGSEFLMYYRISWRTRD